MPWVKGQSGNANGRAKGRRVRITERFLRDLELVWREKGRDALYAAAETEPAQFAKLAQGLLPKDTNLTVTHELSNSFKAALLAAQHTISGAETVIDVTPEPADYAKPL